MNTWFPATRSFANIPNILLIFFVITFLISHHGPKTLTLEVAPQPRIKLSHQGDDKPSFQIEDTTFFPVK